MLTNEKEVKLDEKIRNLSFVLLSRRIAEAEPFHQIVSGDDIIKITH